MSLVDGQPGARAASSCDRKPAARRMCWRRGPSSFGVMAPKMSNSACGGKTATHALFQRPVIRGQNFDKKMCGLPWTWRILPCSVPTSRPMRVSFVPHRPGLGGASGRPVILRCCRACVAVPDDAPKSRGFWARVQVFRGREEFSRFRSWRDPSFLRAAGRAREPETTLACGGVQGERRPRVCSTRVPHLSRIQREGAGCRVPGADELLFINSKRPSPLARFFPPAAPVRCPGIDCPSVTHPKGCGGGGVCRRTTCAAGVHRLVYRTAFPRETKP